MKECRIAFRVSIKEREQINKLVGTGKFKNMSYVIRAALSEFLEKQEVL